MGYEVLREMADIKYESELSPKKMKCVSLQLIFKKFSSKFPVVLRMNVVTTNFTRPS